MLLVERMEEEEEVVCYWIQMTAAAVLVED
jgi:hypothetical protein